MISFRTERPEFIENFRAFHEFRQRWGLRVKYCIKLQNITLIFNEILVYPQDRRSSYIKVTAGRTAGFIFSAEASCSNTVYYQPAITVHYVSRAFTTGIEVPEREDKHSHI